MPHGNTPGLPPPRPIPIKDRSSILFIERGQLDVIDGAFVVVDLRGVRTVIPVGGITCLMLEPGSRVSHAAVVLAARAGTLLIWVGEAGVRLDATGQPGGARADRLLYQARLALDDDARLRVVRRMYARRFHEEPPARRSVDQLRVIEGARVCELYRLLAQRHGVKWAGRNYDPHDWAAPTCPIAACRRRPRPCMGCARQPSWRQDTRQQSAFCTRASRRVSCTM